mmetsp:Transcript_25037/g.82596  ORF Transcript_25037/g.82596 Transcript_25037/m.82596 type:complete len:144 (-) Transcript_25037:1436-1867(-)
MIDISAIAGNSGGWSRYLGPFQCQRNFLAVEEPRMQHSNKHGKVDGTNGRKGMVVSLDVDEYSQFAAIFGAPRIAGDDGPGELLQPFEDGLTWNVRWSKTGVAERTRQEAEAAQGWSATTTREPSSCTTCESELTTRTRARWT